MTKEELIKEIYTYCKANYNEANVVKYSYYFKGEYNAWGLSSPMVREKAKELAKRKELELNTVLDAAKVILKQGKYEEISILLLLIESNYKKFDITVFNALEELFSIGIDNWAHADTLAMFILPRFISQNIVKPVDLKAWLKAKNKFQIRCVPVTLIKSLKTSPDFNELFKIITPLMKDQEREVNQGTGWFLREAWKKDRDITESFLMKWKDISPRLIIQYATEKMTKEERIKFRKVKD